MKKIAFSIMAILSLSQLMYSGSTIAPAEEPVVEVPVVAENIWQQEVTIYGWLAGVSADTRLPGGAGDSSVDVGDIIDDLKMAFMGSYAARYDKWSFILDATYADLGSSGSPDQLPGVTVNVDMKSLLVNTGVGYNIVNFEKALLDVVAGVRYMDLEVDIGMNVLRDHEGSRSKGFVDGIIGLRGAYTINEKWYLPYYADIGTGDSKLTYQLFAGAGYRYDWGDIKFGYRYIGYDMDDDAIVENLNLSGAIVGATIKF